jgi:RNA-directed DNA polymerase
LSNTSKESLSSPLPTNLKQYKTLQDIFTSNFHNKYNFSDFLTFDVNKEVEKLAYNKKTIYKPSSKLKAIQRFLNTCVFEFASINNDVVFSYRKGKSTLDAVKKHASNKYFFQTDISDFFGSIDKSNIEKFLKNNLDNVPIKDIFEYQKRLFELITLNGKLPVGFATSPLVSNSCLYLFDKALHDYCLKNDITYTRYSDDIILSTSNDKVLLDIDKIVKFLLNKSFGTSLSLNPAKTKHTHKGKKLKFLGLVILPTGRVTVDIKIKRKIEASLYYYINDKSKFISIVGDNYESGLATISGQLNYINMIDSEYLNKLRKKYGNTVVDMFFHKSVT